MLFGGFGSSFIKVTKADTTDADVVAFLTAAGITDSTQKKAIAYLAKELKRNILWSKIVALYPFVGGTANTHKFNLKDPRDLDDAFRLQFFGGWMHNASGAKPNGTNAYANTFINPRFHTIQNNFFIGINSFSNISTNNSTDIGCYSSGGIGLIFYGRESSGSMRAFTNTGGANTSLIITNSLGMLGITRTSENNIQFYNNNGLVSGHSTASSLPPNFNLFLAGLNNTGTASQFSSRGQSLTVISDGLTATEFSTLKNIVTGFNQVLGRI
jgi:hypothetical protein